MEIRLEREEFLNGDQVWFVFKNKTTLVKEELSNKDGIVSQKLIKGFEDFVKALKEHNKYELKTRRGR